MRKLTAFLAVAALLMVAGAALAGPTEPASWNYSWGFDNGLEGWALSGNATAAWYGPGSEPMLPDGAASLSKTGDKAVHGGTVHLPDHGLATLDVSSLNLGIGNGRTGFIFQADVYLPNMASLGLSNFNGYPGNGNRAAGIYMNTPWGTKTKTVWAEGTNDGTGRMMAKDSTSNLTGNSGYWIVENMATDRATWWDQWITLRVDYGYTDPTKWSAWAYIPYAHQKDSLGEQPAGWELITQNNATANGSWFKTAQFGGGYSWTQAEFDNFKIATVPEPSSMLALASGLFGLAGFAVRRRK